MPKFLIKLLSPGDEAQTARTHASLLAQSYANWAFAGSLEQAFDFVLFLDAGDVLTPDALFCFAETINSDPQAELLYADEDVLLALDFPALLVGEIDVLGGDRGVAPAGTKILSAFGFQDFIAFFCPGSILRERGTT